jgi:hypothetical protein
LISPKKAKRLQQNEVLFIASIRSSWQSIVPTSLCPLKSSFVRQISQTIWLRLNLLAVPVKAAPKGTALVAPSAYRPVAKRRFRKYFLMGLNFLQSGHQLLCRQISMIRVRNQGFYAFQVLDARTPIENRY